jgi:molybdopterin-guanine dinucleotide biosynthesis protein A
MESSNPSHPVIVLAAGKSSRAGMPKGLIEVNGRPWIEHQIEALKRAPWTLNKSYLEKLDSGFLVFDGSLYQEFRHMP